MPVYDTPQAGSNRTNLGKNISSVDVGRSYALFDGTETPVVDLASVAFARGEQGSTDAGMTFQVQGFGDPGDTVDIQASNTNEDADFATVSTLDETNPLYTDVGRSAFYRAKISALVSAVMPVVLVQR